MTLFYSPGCKSHLKHFESLYNIQGNEIDCLPLEYGIVILQNRQGSKNRF